MTEKFPKLQLKVKELENEIKETKENVEFLTSERSILAEALKEAEENLLKERLEINKEREAIEELKNGSKQLFEKVEQKK